MASAVVPVVELIGQHIREGHRCDQEHILDERQRVPGFLTLQRWISAENPKQSVAIYDLNSPLVLRRPSSKRVTGKLKRLRILPGDAAGPARCSFNTARNR